MTRRWVLVAAALWGGVACAAPLSLEWEAKLVWTLPAATPAWDSNIELTGSLAGWQWTAAATFEDAVWEALTLTGSGTLGAVGLSPSLTFDPQGPAFRALTLPGELELLGLKAEAVARLEGDGFGWGLTLAGPRGAVIERVRLRFNLKRFRDEVLEETFAPRFSFGEARFSVPLECCVARVRGRISFTKAGFEEVGVSFPLPWTLNGAVSFGASLRFRTDDVRVRLFPILAYEVPAGVVLLLGLDWDPATAAVRGIKLFGFGFHGEVGNFRFRSLTSLAEDEINLVKDPHWELLELIWKVPGCCGDDGEVGVTFYFGDAGLLGLGEVEARGDLPVGEGFRLRVSLSSTSSGTVTLAFGWEISF